MMKVPNLNRWELNEEVYQTIGYQFRKGSQQGLLGRLPKRTVGNTSVYRSLPCAFVGVFKFLCQRSSLPVLCW